MPNVSAMASSRLVRTILQMLSLVFFTFLLLKSNCEAITRDAEREVLLSLERDWGRPEAVNWSSTIYTDQCNWAGITCTYGFVTGISLPFHSLSKPIPSAICLLKKLLHIDLSSNNIPGFFPEVLFNCSNLRYLDLSYNTLVGSLPCDINRLSQRLAHLNIASNSLSGSIPRSIGQLQELRFLYLDHNFFDGYYPAELGNLSALRVLHLNSNSFAPATIHGQFGNLTNLKNLSMSQTNIIGEIPDTMSKLTRLRMLDLSYNILSGSFPSWIWSLKKLGTIDLCNNHLFGQIDGSFEAMDLVSVDISMNQLGGKIPDEFSKLKNLEKLNLCNNSLSGSIPESIAMLPLLTDISLSYNFISGSLPQELGKHSSLHSLEASFNNLYGEIPEGLCSNRVLTNIDLSNNALSGEIQSFFSSCYSLQDLKLSNNRLSGRLPITIGFEKLSSLDLSGNKFYGPIPPYIGVLMRLYFLNLSNNQLSGQIPPLLQTDKFEQSFLSNPELCCSNHFAEYPICHGQKAQHLKRLLVIFLVLSLTIVLFIGLFGFFRIRVIVKKQNKNTILPRWNMTTFHYTPSVEHGNLPNTFINVTDILHGLIDSNLIGSGGSGKVYKICLDRIDNKVVAAKKICNDQRRCNMLEKQFQAEVHILGSIRHANIVKLLGCMSSTESKVLIYEYMENNSLHHWLHHKDVPGSNEWLNWARRMSIAIDAARGLCYMHHGCSPPIAHCDVKSSNILLDIDFKAKIADFGLARALAKAGDPESVSAVVGSFGYMAPELTSLRKVNEKVDVYSFGVVLLELTTGRYANGGGGYENLAQWAWRKFQDDSFQLVDVICEDIRDPAHLREVELVFKLGIICTGAKPSGRPSMKQVLQVLQH